MISKNYRYAISITIQAFDDGRFHDFCRDILPLYDEKYRGLERHGATEEGKSRKGTPDLIKTFQDGEQIKQIAVECSTEKKYWDQTEDITKRKPIQDINSCFEKLENLSEIVLCTNRIPPTHLPNAKRDLILYANQKGNIPISIYTLADFENKLMDFVGNAEGKEIFREYFPELYELVGLPEEIQAAYLEKICSKIDPLLTPRDLEEIVEQSISKFSKIEDREQYILTQTESLTPRYEIIPVPAKLDVQRQIPDSSPLINPLGMIVSLVGVAKVGKSALVAQTVEEWIKKGYKVRWFNCPTDPTQQQLFKNYFLKNILSLLLPSAVASELVLGRIGLETFNFNDLELRQEDMSIYIVDNTEILNDDSMRGILSYLKKVKESKLNNKIGVIFISNKTIKYLSSIISFEVPAPYFNEIELKEFLTKGFPQNKYIDEKRYLSHLMTLSGGHPLIAHAIVKKYPTFNDLIVATLSREQFIDKGLSEEAEELLFNDILEDNDCLNFVLRLSPLVYGARKKVLESIMKTIKPEIGKTESYIIERLYGSVLEGNEIQGYSVAPLYKKIADGKNSAEEKKRIYEVCADILLIPKDKTLNVNDMVEGAFYSVLAGNVEKALFWSTILLQALARWRDNNEVRRFALTQLELLTCIKPSEKDSASWHLYTTFLLSMAMNYMNIQNYQRALALMQMIKMPAATSDQYSKEIYSILGQGTQIFKAFSLAQSNPKESIEALISVDWSTFKPIGSVDRNFLNCLDILKELIKSMHFSKLPDNMMDKINKFVDIRNANQIMRLMNIYMIIGAKAQKEGIDKKGIERLIGGDTPAAKIGELIAKAQFIVQCEDYKSTLEILNEVLKTCKIAGVIFKPVSGVVYCLAGDVYYAIKDHVRRKKYYLKSIKHTQGLDSFNFGWANYRLGTITEDSEKAELFFKKASKIFDQLEIKYEFSISEGERGTALVQQNKYSEFMAIVEKIALKYYEGGEEDYSTACTIMLAHTTRLRCMLEGRPVTDSDGVEFPNFERKVYFNAQRGVKPRATKPQAFYFLGKTYSILGDQNKAVEFYNKSLYASSRSFIDRQAELLTITDLLPLLLSIAEVNELFSLFLRFVFIDLSELGERAEEGIRARFFDIVNQFIGKQDCRGKQAKVLYETLDRSQKYLESDSSISFDKKWIPLLMMLKTIVRDKFASSDPSVYQLLKSTYEYGIKHQYNEIIIHAGSQLGFFYIESFVSLSKLAEVHFNVIRAFPSEWFNKEHLRTMAENLYVIWTRIKGNYTKLSTEDRNVKEIILDGAVYLSNKNYTKETAGPFVLLLVARLYDFKGFATRWAVDEITKMGVSLKELDIFEYIKDYFGL